MSIDPRLTANAQVAMDAVRPILAPRKSAAVAALLYSEQLELRHESIKKLSDAIQFLELERAALIELEIEEKQ